MSAVAAIQEAWLTRGAATRVESWRREEAGGARREEERQAALRAVRELASILVKAVKSTTEEVGGEEVKLERGKSKMEAAQTLASCSTAQWLTLSIF